MSLNEITKEVHKAAEETKFMKSVFKKQMTTDVWRDYTYNKMLWYGAIECKARAEGLLDDLYTWHMGDLFGGQMIKKMLPPPHRNLEFKDVDGLKNNLRAKLTDDLGEEAINSFNWAIKIMDEFAPRLPSVE